MHLTSHIKAFQAQWLIKYVDPRQAPWKDIADIWLQRNDRLGRGSIMAAGKIKHTIPQRCKFLRTCLASFMEMGIRQDTSYFPESAQSEPLWRNHRFTIPIYDDQSHEWTHNLNTYRLHDLLSDEGALFTADEWETFIDDLSQDASNLPPAAREQWTEDRQYEVPIIAAHVPGRVKRAIKEEPGLEDGDYALVECSDETQGYVRYTNTGSAQQLEEVVLDISSFPHLTGRGGSLRSTLCGAAFATPSPRMGLIEVSRVKTKFRSISVGRAWGCRRLFARLGPNSLRSLAALLL